MIPDELTISKGEFSAGLVPEIGGSLSFFRWRGMDLMRALSPRGHAARDVLGVAMFPMLPYANRIAGNSFSFANRLWRVEANNPPEKFNVHGSGWLRPWTVKEASASTASLFLEVASGEPHSFRAEQRFALVDGALDVALRIENTGHDALPFGFGLHPWFEREQGVSLRFRARRFFLEEPEGVAGDPVTLPPELDFAAGRPVPSSWRNNNYGGWDGTAEICFPAKHAGLRMKATPIFKHLMLYADPAKPYFCLEPQTNASGALNRGQWDDPDEGLVVLAQNQQMEGSVRFEHFRFCK